MSDNLARLRAHLDLMVDVGSDAQCVANRLNVLADDMANHVRQGAFVLATGSYDANLLASDTATRYLDVDAGNLAALSAMVTELHSTMHDHLDRLDREQRESGGES